MLLSTLLTLFLVPVVYLAFDQLRLRTTYGAAGTQPGPNDALRFFAPTQVNADRTDVGGAILSPIGNADLKPRVPTQIQPSSTESSSVGN